MSTIQFKLLDLRVPAYELPRKEPTISAPKLLRFGGKPASITPFVARTTDLNSLKGSWYTEELKNIRKKQNVDEAGCQAELDDAISNIVRKDIACEAGFLKPMEFLEVHDIEEVEVKAPVIDM